MERKNVGPKRIIAKCMFSTKRRGELSLLLVWHSLFLYFWFWLYQSGERGEGQNRQEADSLSLSSPNQKVTGRERKNWYFQSIKEASQLVHSRSVP